SKNIDYKVTQTDSTIMFDRYFNVKTTDKLRNQEVSILLKIPVNKVILLSKHMENILFDIDNLNDATDNDMVNRRWIMTKQGLSCIDCEGLEKSEKNSAMPIEVPEHPAPMKEQVSKSK
ncbi:MAG: hypothetical protein NTX97_05005, partial [Bacteroidetes bacterium]|nr:hypothetical protein [Bacteroidota bacterium]